MNEKQYPDYLLYSQTFEEFVEEIKEQKHYKIDRTETELLNWYERKLSQYEKAREIYDKFQVRQQTYNELYPFTLKYYNYTYSEHSMDVSFIGQDSSILYKDNFPHLLFGWHCDYKKAYEHAYSLNWKDSQFYRGYFSNQCGGLACTHPIFYGIVLPMSDYAHKIYSSLYNFGYGSNICTYPSLSSLLDYNSLLNSYNLSAEFCYRHLQEACYPIDGSHLPLLTSLEIEDDVDPYKFIVDNYIQSPEKEDDNTLFSPFFRFEMDIRRMNIFILGHNSD